MLLVALVLKDYALANLIGKFPSTALEVVIGHDVVNYKNKLRPFKLIVIVLVCIIYGAIWYYNRRKERKTA